MANSNVNVIEMECALVSGHFFYALARADT